MKAFGKIVGIHLGIFVAYSLLALLFSMGKLEDGAVFSFFTSLAHALVALVLAIVFFVRREGQIGGAHLLSMFLVLIIGFSYCIANVSFH